LILERDSVPDWVDGLQAGPGPQLLLVSQEGNQLRLPALPLISVSQVLAKIAMEDPILSTLSLSVNLPVGSVILEALKQIIIDGEVILKRTVNYEKLTELISLLGIEASISIVTEKAGDNDVQNASIAPHGDSELCPGRTELVDINAQTARCRRIQSQVSNSQIVSEGESYAEEEEEQFHGFSHFNVETILRVQRCYETLIHDTSMIDGYPEKNEKRNLTITDVFKSVKDSCQAKTNQKKKLKPNPSPLPQVRKFSNNQKKYCKNKKNVDGSDQKGIHIGNNPKTSREKSKAPNKLQKMLKPCFVNIKEIDDQLKKGWSINSVPVAKVLRFCCDQCDALFTQKVDMTRHKKLLHSASGVSYKCLDCNRVYFSKQGLSYHKATAHNKENLRCNRCKESFTTIKEMLSHKKSVHLKVTITSPKIILECKRKFHYRKVKAKHRTPPVFHCNHCEETFDNPKQASHHRSFGHK